MTVSFSSYEMRPSLVTRVNNEGAPACVLLSDSKGNQLLLHGTPEQIRQLGQQIIDLATPPAAPIEANPPAVVCSDAGVLCL